MKEINIEVKQEDIDESLGLDPFRNVCPTRNCPVACALRREGFEFTAVEEDNVQGLVTDGESFDVALPMAATHFIELFDENCQVEPFSFVLKVGEFS